jgi:putative membrane-bound dehydrogenase-like protein
MMAALWIVLGVLAAEPEGVGPRAVDSRLAIELFAAAPDIVTPTGLTVDRAGRVLVIESHTHFRPANYAGPAFDRIRRLEDTDGDGRADRVTTFCEGSTHTMGLGFHPDGTLFVATRSAVFRLRDADDDGQADAAGEPVARLETRGNYPHNGLAGFAFDAEGRVYFGLGENLGAAYQLVGTDGVTLAGGGEGGNVYRCRPDGTGLERLATGFWNPFHQAFDAFGRLFIVDNDPDSRPPCRLIHVVPGGDYGYRFRNGRKGLHPFTAWNGELPGTLPMAAGTGEAPSGLIAYESDNLPEDYRGAILATSWGDHRLERFKLERKGASFKGRLEPVVKGGENFRPVGIATAPDGSVFVSDWVDKSYTLHGKGRVWHLRALEASKRSLPKDDAEALGHPDRGIRESAARRLAGGGEPGWAVLRREMKSQANPRARAAALDALISTAAAGDDETFRVALADPSEDVRALAVRRLPASLLNLPSIAAKDAPPLVRAEALRRFSGREARETLLTALEDADPFTRQAAREGMRRAFTTAELLAMVKAPTVARRLGSMLVLRESADPSALDALPDALNDTDPAVRFVAVQWVGESGLDEFRGALRQGLVSGSMTGPLFEAYLAALARLDGERRGPKEEIPGAGYVAAMVADPTTPPLVLRRALRVLPTDDPALTIGRLTSFLRSPEPAVRLEAARTLRTAPVPRRDETLRRLAADVSAPLDLRAEAIVGLSGDDRPSRWLLLALASDVNPTLRHEAERSLRGSAVSPEERARIVRAGRDDPETAALLDHLNAKPETAGVSNVAERLAKLEGPADPVAGERVFYHPKGPGCYRCHKVEGRGGDTGPELSTTGQALTRERLVESIVNPDKEVAPQFVAWHVELKDGTVLTGTLLDESATGEQIYGDVNGSRITLSPAQIESRRPQTTSIMPSGLDRLMTDQEFRDLIAFLRAARQAH